MKYCRVRKCSSPGSPFGRLLFSSGIYALAGLPGEAGPPSPSPLALMLSAGRIRPAPCPSRQSRPRLGSRVLGRSLFRVVFPTGLSGDMTAR